MCIYSHRERERENGSSNLTRKRRNVYTLTERENDSRHMTRQRGNVYAIRERERKVSEKGGGGWSVNYQETSDC